MAYQTIYKDIGIADEATWGTSIASTTRKMHIRTSTLGLNPNKGLVEDIMTSMKGRERMVQTKNDVSGDLTGYATPRSLHEAYELVNLAKGVTSALGASAMIIDYVQNTSGTITSKTINTDRNNSQEKFNGVFATALDISWSDGLVEWTANCLAKTRAVGAVLSDTIGETVKPYNYGDVTVTVHAGATYGAQPVTLAVSSGNVKYDNGAELAFLSGSNDASRADPKIPSVTGKLKIFHTGSSWVSAFTGASEFYLRIQMVTNSAEGLIAGVTPYMNRIDVPRIQFTSNVRNFEQAAISVEEIEYTGMFDYGTSALWKPQQTVPFDV